MRFSKLTKSYYTRTEAAAVLGLSRQRVAVLVASGRIPALAGRLISAANLDRFRRIPRDKKGGRPKVAS